MPQSRVVKINYSVEVFILGGGDGIMVGCNIDATQPQLGSQQLGDKGGFLDLIDEAEWRPGIWWSARLR